MRLRSRHAAGVLACLTLALSPLIAAGQSAAADDDTVTAPIVVTLASLRPVAPQPEDVLVVRGSVTNVSDATVTDLSAGLRMSGPISARSTFDDFAADPNGSVDELTESLGQPAPLTRTSLGPGASEPFEISVTLDPATTGLPDSTWEVRELGVAVTGDSLGVTGTVGALRTFLPWAPRDAVGPTQLQVAWLWPLIDQPHRVTSTWWTDDDLASELAAGGRLDNLVTAAAAAAQQAPPPVAPQDRGSRHGRRPPRQPPNPARDVPVTWVLDPMLVDDVNAMRSSYQVAGSPKPTPGKGSSAAKSWLSALRSATSGQPVVPVPYGDPDVVAAVRGGLSTLVGVAATAGRALLGQLLPDASLLPTGWPPGGVLDQRAADALFSDDATSLVLSDAALPPLETPNETPSSRASLVTAAGDIPTALSDSILSDAVSAGANSGADSAVALQRYLGETLMIEAEAPSDQRSILIAPAPRWQPSQSYAANLLADTGKVPWLEPTTLSTILAQSPDSAVERQSLTYPSADRASELPPAYVGQVAQRQHALSQLTSILPPGDPETRPLSAGLLRALSTAWRGVAGPRRGWMTDFSRALRTMTSGVHIVSKAGSTVTLTGHGGKVPVTIANTLDAPAQITVQLDAHERLTLPNHGRVAVTVPADQQTTVDVHATAKTSGVFSLDVQLLTPNGQKYGTPVQLFVRSTVYGTITLVITGVATAALLVAVAIRLTRRAINARRASSAPTA
ncbi:MAG TPA: DUF6049 family protein [Mycobacteriales bacterium]|nr:DUF6049 family protein [Mycobacteriales bacterium]